MPGERLDMRDAPGCKLEQCFTAGAHGGAHAGADAKQNSRVCLCSEESWRPNCDELTQTAFVWHQTLSNVYFQEITQVLAAAILMGNSRANTDVDHDNHQGSIRLLRRRGKAWHQMDQNIRWLTVWVEVNLLFAVSGAATKKPPTQSNKDKRPDLNMDCNNNNKTSNHFYVFVGWRFFFLILGEPWSIFQMWFTYSITARFPPRFILSAYVFF